MKAFVLWTVTAALLITAAPLCWGDSDGWSLLDTKGETFKVTTDSAGSPTLLIFWATWCIPCKKEMSDNKPFFDAYVKKGVNVLLISEDNARTSSKVKPYIESRGFTQHVLLDTKGDVLKRYGGTSLPFTVLLDKQGEVVEKFRGALKDTGALAKQLDKLIGTGQ